MLRILRILIAVTVFSFWPLVSNGAEIFLDLLKKENHFAMLRHAKAPGIGDPANFNLLDCKTQRNLSAEGIQQGEKLGKKLKEALGNNYQVFTSQWCRCRDTAKLLGGKNPEDLPLLNSFFQNSSEGPSQTAALKSWLKRNVSNKNKIVLVTHQVNITELTGIFPAEGEILIFKISKEDKISEVARLKED